NGDGTIITRLGQTPPLSPVNPPVSMFVTSGGTNTLTDSAANFPTANGGLTGFVVVATASDGTNQTRTIVSNTATQLTVDTAWAPIPDNTYTYRISVAATATTLTDPLANFTTTYGGLVGLVVQAISGDGHVQFRTITANTATQLTISKP